MGTPLNPALTKRLEVLSRQRTAFRILEDELAQAEVAKVRRLLQAASAGRRKKLDASDLERDVVTAWLQSLPISATEQVTLLWPAYSAGIRLPFSDFVKNYDELWYPAAEDLWVRDEKSSRLLEMDHEEEFTFFHLSPISLVK